MLKTYATNLPNSHVEEAVKYLASIVIMLNNSD